MDVRGAFFPHVIPLRNWTLVQKRENPVKETMLLTKQQEAVKHVN